MWDFLTIQSLLFFLFFQPRLLARRRVRYMILILSLLVSCFLLLSFRMDPFAWLLMVTAIFLTYWTANKALRWVFTNRDWVRRQAMELEREEEAVKAETARKETEVEELHVEIQRVSNIYENLKEMSGSLEILDLFVDLAEAVIRNFTVRNVRMLLLKPSSDHGRIIDKVYQIDPTRSEFRAPGKGLTSKELMFQGQAFALDLKIVEVMNRKPKPVYLAPSSSGAAAGNEVGEEVDELAPAVADTLFALPIRANAELNAVLMVEGMDRSDSEAISILTDRFISEFRRILLYEDVQRLATTDWLTGLYVRRYFFRRLEEEIGRCQRFNLRFSFLMIDIDDFKTYNDRYGHLVGDALLKRAAHIIKQNVREVDLVARYGGEEFAAILLDTDAEGAMYVGQRIRKNIEKEHFKVYDEEIKLTVSIGLATYNSKITEGSEIVEWADSALYQAKRQGKNRVCAFVNG